MPLELAGTELLNLAKEKKDIFDDASRPLTAREIFAGDEALYKILDNHAEAPNTLSPQLQSASKINLDMTSSVSNQRLSVIKIAIRVCIGLIAVLLLVPISLYCVSAMFAPPHQQTMQPVTEHVSSVTRQTPAAPAVSSVPIPEDEPVSWKLAQAFYQKGEYAKASAAYNRLSRSLLLTGPTQAMWDGYLKLRLGLCAYNLKDIAASETYFADALQSSSPAVVALANYHLAFMKNEQKNYPDARTRAYKALALLETIDSKYSEALIADCFFLIAQALTADAISGSSQTLDVPIAWPQTAFSEPLEQLDEAQLQNLLQSSTAVLSSAAMGPQIQKRDFRGSITRCLVKCSGASIEELFGKFGSGDNQDVRWSDSYEDAHSRPVMLYLASASPQKFFEIASGSVGLLASFEDNQVLIHDPGTAVSVAQHRSLLIAEAISVWQRFILSYRLDNRIADAHFAMGLLQQSDNRLPAAIGEFRQVANRYIRSRLAPYSLVNAAKIKLDMQDDAGALEHLKELCAQYPDSPVTDKATLLLAQTSAKLGNYEYAGRIYRKVCNLNVSEDYKLAGMLGAAKCYLALKDFASAADWLSRYAAIAKKNSDNAADLREAYLMLAEANIQLEKLDEACRSYQSAFILASTADDKFDIALKLVTVYIHQENFVEALDAAEKIDISQLSERQIAHVWLVKAQILHAMNLDDQAVSLLAGRINAVQDTHLRSEMSLQLARSHIALNDLEAARDILCQALLHSEPGLLTTKLQCELADVCVKLGDNTQAVTICSQILASSISDELRSRTRNILGTAYANQKQYDKAAKIFSGSVDTAGAKQL